MTASSVRLPTTDWSASGWWSRRVAHWNSTFGRTATTATEVELEQRRIYLLPTGRGFFLIITAAILLLVGVNYQLSLAYVVAFLLAGLMQVALFASYRNLRGLVVASGRSPHCRVGETVAFPITLASPERPRDGITLSSQYHPNISSSRRRPGRGDDVDQRLRKQWARSGPNAINADERKAAPLNFVAGRRGLLPLGRIIVESRAPYGLIRAWSYVHFEWVALIDPIPELPPPALPTASGADGVATGTTQVAHDPDSLREFVHGDSLRRVAWKQVAKSGQWYTRTGDTGTRHEIDLSWQMVQLTETEARLARMAAWLTRAHNENCAYSLSMPNAQLPLADGSQQFADASIVLAVYPLRSEDVRGLR